MFILNFLLISFIFIGCYFVLSFIVYRSPNFQKIKYFEGDVIFKAIDLQFDLRNFFEKYILRSHSILLTSENMWFYIRKEDLLKVYKEIPQGVMKYESGIKVKLNAQPLLFGGYGLSSIDQVIKTETSMLRIK